MSMTYNETFCNLNYISFKQKNVQDMLNTSVEILI